MDVMYVGRYLRFIEMAESAFFRTRGFTYDELTARFGIWLARVHVAIDFRRPARLDDELCAWAELRKLGGSSLRLAFPVERAGVRLADGTLVLAALDRETLKPVRLPGDLVAALET